MIQPAFHAAAACLDRLSGTCDRLTVDEAVEKIKRKEGVVWLNIEGDDDRAIRTLLADRLGFHDLAIEDALSNAERPSLQEYEDVLFFVFPVIQVEEGREKFVELAFFLSEQSLVTYSEKPLPFLREWFQQWQQRPTRANGTPSRLAHILVDAIVDSYFPIVDVIEDEVDDIGDRVFAGDVRQVKRIQLLKRRLLQIRRRLSPTRDVLNGLLRRNLPAIPEAMEPYYQDVLDHTLRLGELVDMNRDTLASLLDVHLSTVSNNINEVMKRMTFISTALMSSTMIAGIYGMNFERMPELHWMFGYPFALALMVAAYFGVYVYFKRKGWL